MTVGDNLCPTAAVGHNGIFDPLRPRATVVEHKAKAIKISYFRRCEREMCPWAISKYFGD
jgi:hypothetical protein